MKIVFLIGNAYGMGGTIRTVFTLAHGLSRNHTVEIVSVVRHRAKPFFPAPPGVSVRALAPTRDRRDRPRQRVGDLLRERRASVVLPAAEAGRGHVFNGRTERELRAFLRDTDADVVVGTRPGVNLLLARWAPDRVVTVGQEHVHLDNHTPAIREAIRALYPRLDGMLVLTATDRHAYERHLSAPPGWVTTMPNPLPPGPRPRAALDTPTIAAAGRLTPIKQYDKLLQAFAIVSEYHPEWRLRIYGGRGAGTRLPDLIRRAGVHERVTLMGRVTDLPRELANASLLAVSSRAEGFGMTIIEAFSVGVPVVSFDCPHGPREIITHGSDGLLVPPQDVAALTFGMLRLVEDREERERMGDAAARRARHFELDPITRRWEDFLAERLAERAGTAARHPIADGTR